MDKHTDYNLIAKYLAGECTIEEKRNIEIRMKTDSAFSEAMQEFEKIWTSKKTDPNFEWDIEGVWSKLAKEMDSGEKEATVTKMRVARPYYESANTTGTNWIIRIAAVLLVSVLTSLFALVYMNEEGLDETISMREVVTESGQRATVHLDDGTRIRLNSGSKLIHPHEFENGERKVQLFGEAYFEIAKDERPFIVHADEALIEILGTEFNVQAYDEFDEIKVVVAEGRVAVRSDRQTYDNSAFLEKGDMASLMRGSEGRVTITQNVDLRRHLGWIEYRLNFDNIPLGQVAATLQRWYGVEIQFSDDHLKQMKLTADFEDASIHEVIRVMEIALNLQYQMQGRTITFYSNL